MSDDYDIDWNATARIERLERDAFRKQNIVLIRLDQEPNKILKRLAEDRAVSKFGPRDTSDRNHNTTGSRR